MAQQHTVAYKLFHYYFKCYIPQYCLYSEAYYKEMGIPTTQDRAIDRTLANNPVLSQVTIAQMAEHFANGATLQLEKPEESAKIYQLITAHLDDWQVISNDPLDTTEPPVEDLRKLDALATELYKTARGYLSRDQLGNRLFKGLAALESQRAIDRHDPETNQNTSLTMPKEHHRVTELIGQASFKKKRQWFNKG